MSYDNSPVVGCPTCQGTAGRMACPIHGSIGWPAEPKKFDTTNHNMVCLQGDMIRVMYPPLRPISKAEALSLAAWLVADHGCRKQKRKGMQLFIVLVKSAVVSFGMEAARVLVWRLKNE